MLLQPLFEISNSSAAHSGNYSCLLRVICPQLHCQDAGVWRCSGGQVLPWLEQGLGCASADNKLATMTQQLNRLRVTTFHLNSFDVISFPFLFLPCVSFDFMTVHFISCHFISFRFISFHFVSFHIIPFRVISCEFLSVHFNAFRFNSIQIVSFHVSFVSFYVHSPRLHFTLLRSVPFNPHPWSKIITSPAVPHLIEWKEKAGNEMKWTDELK